MARRSERDRDLDDEIAHDIAVEAGERMRQGQSHAEAERASRRDFGNTLAIKEATRDTWSKRWWQSTVIRDFRHGVRRLVRMPLFTATAVGALAVGIAGCIAVFSIANAILLRPLDVPQPERLVVFETASPEGTEEGASPAMFFHWRELKDAVEPVAALAPSLFTETSGGAPDEVRAGRVTTEFFSLVGLSASRGRLLTDLDYTPGASQVAVISRRLAERRWPGGDAVGRQVRLNGDAYTVIGVLAGERDRHLRGDADVFLPLPLQQDAKSVGQFFVVYGRLREGVALSEARARVNASTDGFRRAFPQVVPAQAVFTLDRVQDTLDRDAGPLLFALLATVALVLAIACANVATLLLLNGAERRRELAVRSAVGASRARIIRQLLAESVLLASAGGAAGFALGWVALRVIVAWGLPDLPRLQPDAGIPIDWRVAAFAVGVSMASALIFGLVPTVRLSRVALRSAVDSSPRSGRSPQLNRAETVLVVLQTALALILLLGSLSIARRVVALTQVDLGFDATEVVALETSLGGREVSSPSEMDEVVRRGLESVRAVPSVQAAGVSFGMPFETGFGLPMEIIGRPMPADQWYHGGVAWWTVSDGYFEALRIPIRRGRVFTAADRRLSAPVVIINETLARQFWPNVNPVGQRITVGRGAGPQFADEPVREIIGVAGDVRDRDVDGEAGATAYEPLTQLPGAVSALLLTGGNPLAWFVRTGSDPAAVTRPIQLALEREIELPVTNPRPMREVVSESIGRERLAMRLMGVFGVTALALAAFGLYGLIAYGVAQRAREIGIRLALGAARDGIRWLVIGRGLRLTLAGMAIGLSVAALFTRTISQALFDASLWEAPVLAGALIVVFGTSILATWVPGRRASRIDPAASLRLE